MRRYEDVVVYFNETPPGIVYPHFNRESIVVSLHQQKIRYECLGSAGQLSQDPRVMNGKLKKIDRNTG